MVLRISLIPQTRFNSQAGQGSIATNSSANPIDDAKVVKVQVQTDFQPDFPSHEYSFPSDVGTGHLVKSSDRIARTH